MLLDLLRLFLFPSLVAFAAASDLLTMTISNRVSALLLAGFFVLAFAGGLSATDVLMHCAAGMLVLSIAFACFAFGWVGGGDAKMAAVASVWFGFPLLFDYMFYTALCGGALTLAMLQFRKLPVPYMLGRQDWLLRLHDKDSGIPYGIALAFGALVVYPDTPWIRAIDLARFLGH